MDSYKENKENKDYKDYKEYKEIDPKTRDKDALIKSIMIQLDKWFPSDQICDESFREKQYLRSKIMDCINAIAKFELQK